jgi:hypothetical protein
LRRAPSGKARDRHIEAPPEHMHRADLVKEAGAEMLENPIDPQQYPPEALRIFRIIDSVHTVLFERSGTGNFVWHAVNVNM